MGDIFEGTRYEDCAVSLMDAKGTVLEGEKTSHLQQVDDERDNALIRDVLTVDETIGTEWFDLAVGSMIGEIKSELLNILIRQARMLGAHLEVLQNHEDKKVVAKIKETLDEAIYLARYGVHSIIYGMLDGTQEKLTDLHAHIEHLHGKLPVELKYAGDRLIYEGTDYERCNVTLQNADGQFPARIERHFDYTDMVREARELGFIRSLHQKDPDSLRPVDAQHASWAVAHLWKAGIGSVTLKVAGQTVEISDLEREYDYWHQESIRLQDVGVDPIEKQKIIDQILKDFP